MSLGPTVQILSINEQPRNLTLISELERLGFTRITIAGVKFPGPDTASRAELVDESRFRRFFLRNMVDGEIGCHLSHQLAYQFLLAEDDQWLVILEDDAEILPEFDEAVRTATSLSTDIPYIIALNALQIGSPGIGNKAPPLLAEPLSVGNDVTIHEALFGGWGSVGYVINRKAAELLTNARKNRRIAAPADWPTVSTHITFAQAIPPVVVEQSQSVSTIGARVELASSIWANIVYRALGQHVGLRGYPAVRDDFDDFRAFLRWTYGPARYLIGLPWIRNCGDVRHFHGYEFRFVSDAQVRRRFRWIGLGPSPHKRRA